MIYRTLSFIMSIIFLMALASCSTWQGANQQQKGTVVGTGVGAAVGAGLGQAFGHDTRSTVAGAAIGALLGGIAGNQIGAYMDRQEQALRDLAAQNEAMSVQREQNVLTATFKSDLMFDFDSAKLKSGAYAELDRVAGILRDYPQTQIRVEGYTDQTGSETYNQQLSERRAIAVKTALVQRGVADYRIQAIGLGESNPISSDPAINRRVEIHITPLEQQG